MSFLRTTLAAGLSVMLVSCFATNASALAIELTTNGGFETGDYTGWQNFGTSGNPTPPGTPGPSDQQTITNVNPSGGSFAAEINNNLAFGNSLIKQANLAPGGQIQPGQLIEIQFDARGTFATPGGVAFAEFFTELAGGGTSKAEILGGGPPLAINPDPNVWTTFNFTTTAGPDTSGGVTLQLGATTGPAGGTVMYYDNVSVSVSSLLAVPEPASVALFGMAGVGMLVRRRR